MLEHMHTVFLNSQIGILIRAGIKYFSAVISIHDGLVHGIYCHCGSTAH